MKINYLSIHEGTPGCHRIILDYILSEEIAQENLKDDVIEMEELLVEYPQDTDRDDRESMSHYG